MPSMRRRKRLSDGTLGPFETVDEGLTPEQQIAKLEDMNKALMLTVTDMYEENIDLHELNRNVMLVVTDLYEAVYPEEGDI